MPQSLLALVNTILKGLSIEHQIQLVNASDTSACKLRASYQAYSYCWNMAMCLVPELPNPEDWGWWKDDRGWHPLWTTKRLHYEVQMCQGCSKMYSAMFLLWRMLNYSLLSIYAYTCYVYFYVYSLYKHDQLCLVHTCISQYSQNLPT